MSFFVEHLEFSQLSAGDYIEFSNDISGNDEYGTVQSTSEKAVKIQQWDVDLDGDVVNTYGPTDISNITKIK